jgi:hypothetical protein
LVVRISVFGFWYQGFRICGVEMGWSFDWLWRNRDGVELKVVVFVLVVGWFMLEGWGLKLFT